MFFSTDSGYVPHLCVAVKSASANCCAPLSFRILSDPLSDGDKKNIEESATPNEVEFYAVNRSDFEKFDVVLGHLSLAACYRYLVSELCPDVDKAIYLDCDLVVLGDLAELFREDLSGLYAAAVEDCVRQRHVRSLGLSKYFNSGVLLLNLEKIRSDNLVPEFFRISTELSGKSKYLDQDVLNLAFKEKVLWLHPKWNAISPIFRKIPRGAGPLEPLIDACNTPSVVHFTGPDKPWRIPRSIAAHPWSPAYFHYLKQTPFSGLAKKYNDGFALFKVLTNYFRRHLFFFLRPHFQRMRGVYRRNRETFK